MIDGDSLLFELLGEESLDWSHGGQFLHLTYLLEHFLQYFTDKGQTACTQSRLQFKGSISNLDNQMVESEILDGTRFQLEAWFKTLLQREQKKIQTFLKSYISLAQQLSSTK